MRLVDKKLCGFFKEVILRPLLSSVISGIQIKEWRRFNSTEEIFYAYSYYGN